MRRRLCLPHDPDRCFLFLVSPRDWMPDDHREFCVSDTADALRLSGFYAPYEGDERPRPPFDPRMARRKSLRTRTWRGGSTASRSTPDERVGVCRTTEAIDRKGTAALEGPTVDGYISVGRRDEPPDVVATMPATGADGSQAMDESRQGAVSEAQIHCQAAVRLDRCGTRLSAVQPVGLEVCADRMATRFASRRI